MVMKKMVVTEMKAFKPTKAMDLLSTASLSPSVDMSTKSAPTSVTFKIHINGLFYYLTAHKSGKWSFEGVL